MGAVLIADLLPQQAQRRQEQLRERRGGIRPTSISRFLFLLIFCALVCL